MAKKRLLISRAKWKNSWYRREGKSGTKGVTWRNKNSGAIAKKPSGNIIGFEKTGIHNYGSTGLTKKKIKSLELIYKPRKKRR